MVGFLVHVPLCSPNIHAKSVGPLKNEDQIYSILPIGSILSNVTNNDRSAASSPSPHAMTYHHQSAANFNSKISESSNDTDTEGDVRNWMDKSTAAREAAPDLTSSSRSLLPTSSSPSTLMGVASDWYSSSALPVAAYAGAVDWADAGDARARRRSLPTDPQAALASTSTSAFAVPFPSVASTSTDPYLASKSDLTPNGTTSLAKKSPGKSKLRQTLSVIGEGSTVLSSHSRDSTYTARGPPEGLKGALENTGDSDGDDDNVSTERDSIHSKGAPGEDETIQRSLNESESESKQSDGGSGHDPEAPELLPTTTGAFEASEAVI